MSLCLIFFRDLLSGDPSYKMEVKMKSDGGLHVPGLCSEEVKSVEDVNQVGFNSEQRMVSKKCRIIILAGTSYMWDYSL